MKDRVMVIIVSIILALALMVLATQPAHAKEYMGHGTGYFITDDGVGVSNAHVADPGKSDPLFNLFVSNLEVVAVINGVKYPIQIIAEDLVNDIVIFKVIGVEKSKGLPITATIPKQGADVMLLGYGINNEASYASYGVFNTVMKEKMSLQQFLTANILMYPGHSGSPLINNGQVVGTVEGVPVAANSVMLGYSLFVPEQVVVELAKSVNAKIKTISIIESLMFNSLTKIQQSELVQQSVFPLELYGDVALFTIPKG